MEVDQFHRSVTLDRVMDGVRRRRTALDDPGFCVACGHEPMGVEPDARNYECESCGEHEVYGCEELLIMMG